jgi:hypothetical protein
MKHLHARHIQSPDCVRRGIPNGWYAMSRDDAVCSGVFATQEACEAHIESERADISAYHHGATNQH